MAWILLLCAAPGGGEDPREFLAAAVREARPAEARAALADLLRGNHARAARALVAALPRARERAAAPGTASIQARMEYDRIDTEFTFNPFEDRARERQLAEALERIREAERRAVDAERVYDLLREAMGTLGPAGTEVLAAEAARTASWLLKCELLEGLGSAGAREALLPFLDRREPPAALEFLDHPRWQVRLAALQGLRGVRAAAGAIVGRMAEPDARFRREAAAVLREMTGTGLPADPEAWSGWWRANGTDFIAGSYDPRRPKAPEGPGHTTFYSIPVVSSRVCFVIDRQRYDGGTDLHRALEKALLPVGSPESGRLREEGPDTIVVLSDGRATLGRFVDEELLGRVLARRARYLRPVFHTISLCPGARSLKLLAELTGGEHRVHAGP